MKINIIMLACGRAQLTLQAIRSLYQNTPLDSFNLTVVNDGPEDFPGLPIANADNVSVLELHNSGHILGRNRNLGVIWSEKRFGRGDFLYLSDNDVVFLPKWSERLTGVYENPGQGGFQLIGGCNHPFHQAMKTTFHNNIGNEGHGIREYTAVAGTSHLMRWWVWDKYGPQVETQSGVGASEDFEYCQRIREAGFRVGAIWPEVVIDTGITQTGGTPSPGANIKANNKVPGITYV